MQWKAYLERALQSNGQLMNFLSVIIFSIVQPTVVWLNIPDAVGVALPYQANTIDHSWDSVEGRLQNHYVEPAEAVPGSDFSRLTLLAAGRSE